MESAKAKLCPSVVRHLVPPISRSLARAFSGFPSRRPGEDKTKMLKSHAPSRIGRRSLKRRKTKAAAGSDDDSSTAASRKAAAGRFAVASAPVVEGRLPVRAAVKVSINGVKPRPALQGWQEPRYENKMKATTTAVQKIGRRSLTRERTEGACSSSGSSSSRVEATKPSRAASSTAAGLVRRVKGREQKRSAAVPESSSGDIEWRVPSPSCSTKPPPPPPPSPPPASPPSTRSVTDSSANGITINNPPSRIVRKSSTSARASPSKKPASSTSTAASASASAPAPAPAEEEPDQEEQLPPCPYPGHQNVSWTCRACGGAKHHLTSRSAMEPLQRAHGFKVHRVPNDGDCFFSAIKAALQDGVAAERARGGEGGGAAAGGGSALTVRQMREWVAEEMGQDQLDFYILQAGANPEDRWLDFVRPLVDRIPSDNEEEEGEEEGEEDDDDSYREETEGEASQSQPRQCTPTSRKPPSSRSRPSRAAAAAAATAAPRTPKAAGSGGGGVAHGRRKGRTGSEQQEGKRSTSGRSAKEKDAGAPEDSKGVTLAAVVSPPSASSDRNARYLRRREGRGLLAAAAAAAAAATKAAASTKKNPKAKSSSARQRATAEAEAGGTSSRRSSRFRKGKETSAGLVGEEGSGGEEEKEEEGEEEDKDGAGEETEAVGWRWENDLEEEDKGLPVVETVEELRRFVRLEGSDVGQGNCMWADTHAHHVVSRRLKITILFVDMEREKRAWPYRVLARTVTESDDEEEERFVVLKREPSHFVLLETAPSPEDSDGAVGSDSGGGGGGGVATKKKRKGGRGQACFSRSELPDVVRRLWQL